ncbi:MAG: type II toxin-antitoxin system death-on-curing family toxin [Candidatus Sungbacteria bacterium]|nr:type II toxin-antitoxin system death-on-curing family toxin [Candidatus Sungbacteria bacterium]
MAIDETGGMHGVRDMNAILALVDLSKQKAFGQELYKGVFLKTAVYVRNIISSHPFLDGNKRTAMVVAGVFLEENGYKIVAEEGEIEKYAIDVAIGNRDLEWMSTWFKKHAEKMKK